MNVRKWASCKKNGRPDSMSQNWRWKPKGRGSFDVGGQGGHSVMKLGHVWHVKELRGMGQQDRQRRIITYERMNAINVPQGLRLEQPK
ncbi:unnamed protein product [Dovyalis caffra]|uniref:Uncharacterized protein n=1 Tax=Dovyalis caffra TaxID=77055 RepID=A0AAV1R0T1_9ROSI|nr:unnamed protein product [Dovyalis caffra]